MHSLRGLFLFLGGGHPARGRGIISESVKLGEM
jgi:hypothetical protein